MEVALYLTSLQQPVTFAPRVAGVGRLHCV